MDPRFAHVRDWIFDLDNCLYPASTGLFALIDERMGAYIQRLLDCDPVEARRVQKAHFHTHGTTLAGLMEEYGVDPHDFLDDVHDIALDRVSEDRRLAGALERLPGRKFVFTNGDGPYARRVLEALGIHGHFNELHDIHASELRPKPHRRGYDLICERYGIDPGHALMVEDMAQNLKPAKALGMTTVWVDNGSERGNHAADDGFIDYRIEEVGAWLEEILKESAMNGQLEAVIDAGWERRELIDAASSGELNAAVESALAALDRGELRIAEKVDGSWRVNQWLKKAVLLSFRLNPMEAIPGGPGGANWWDKVPSKFAGWTDAEFKAAGFRAVPGAIVRRGAYVAPGAVLMPSFVNIGAYVGEGTMVDTWATVGSCAQIGRNVHISGGAGIGGVLEPLQAGPVIIEDNCFVGARSEVAEGVVVEEGSVLSMGVFLGASTKIVDRASGEVFYGRVPAYSVVVPGAMPGASGGPSLACAVIVKRVDERTRSKTSINELLRD